MKQVRGVPATVETIPIKAGKKLRTLRGNLLELSAMAETQNGDLLRILIDAEPTSGLADQVRDLFPQAIDVRILRRSENKQSQEGHQKLLERSPQELFAKYLNAGGLYDESLVKLFNQLLEEIDEASTT
ncbi:MAG: exonuclease SbcCD subunit D C-terminal domain-containing protein [Saprospiraceae bacterium]|nr:exonuclease SbcCD subunit D C-terminal domain-containing protein [Saprospiraceae bacterium]